MNRKTFQDGMKLLSATWPDRSPSSQTLAAYWMALSDLSDDVWLQAVGRVLKTSKFFPAPAELRSAATEVLTSHGMLPDEPEPAWAAVLGMARRWSPYQPTVEFEDQAIARTVKELGGIGRIALADDRELPFLRKDFLARYAVYRQRAIDTSRDVFGRMLPAGDDGKPELADGKAA